MKNQIFKKGLVWILSLAMVLTSLSLNNIGMIVADAASSSPETGKSTYSGQSVWRSSYGEPINDSIPSDFQAKQRACMDANGSNSIWLVYIRSATYTLEYTALETFEVNDTTYSSDSSTTLISKANQSAMLEKMKNAGYYKVIFTVTYTNNAVRTYEYSYTIEPAKIKVVDPVDYVETVTSLNSHLTRINLEGVDDEVLIGQYTYPESEDVANIDTPDVKNLDWTFTFPEKINANNYKADPASGTEGRVIFREKAWTTSIAGSVTQGQYGDATVVNLHIEDNKFGTADNAEIWTYTLYDNENEIVQGSVEVNEDNKKDGQVQIAFKDLLSGTYTVKVSYSNGFTTTDGEEITVESAEDYTKQFTVDKRKVTFIGQSGINKIYDETTLAYQRNETINKWIFTGSSSTLEGYKTGDDLTITAEGNYEKAEVGKDINIDWSSLTLSGESAEYYELTATTGTSIGNILPAELTISCNSSYFTLKKNYANPNMESEFNFSASADYLKKIDEEKELTVDNAKFENHSVTSNITRKFELINSSLVPAGLEIANDGTITSTSTETTNDNVGLTDIWPTVKVTLANNNYNLPKSYEIPYRVVGVDIYDINLNLNGGSINDEDWSNIYITGEEKLLPTDVIKAGYTFAGWTDENGDTVTSIPETAEGAKTFNAVWELNTYTISYDLDGGTNASDNPANYTIESEDITLAAPTKTGYTFAGWTEDGDTIESIAAGSYGDKALVANWTKDSYTITYVLNGATANASSNPTTYSVDTDTITLADVSKPYYSFDGWYINETPVQEIAKGSTGNLTLTAEFTPILYKINYDVGSAPDVEGTTTNPTTYTVEDTTITLSNPTRAGYNFLNWTNENNEVITEIDTSEGKERTITAHWELITYDITYTYPEGVETEVTTNKNPETYNVENGTFSFVDPIRKGYTFNGWTLTKVDNTDKNEPISAIIKGTLTGNLTLNGTFTATAYDINYDLDGGVNAEVNPATYTIEDNAITLANPTKKGYNFSKWVDDKGDEVTEIPAGSTGEVSVKAVWTRDTYTISYDLAGGTTAEANPESYNVDTETITLVDATKKGYTFDGWYNGDEKVTKIETGNVGNLTLVAKFTLDIYNVTYDLAGGTNAEANPETYTVNSEKITLAAPTKANYTFDGWVDNENKEVTEIPAGSTGNVELTATWTAIDYDITYTGVEGATNTNPTTYNVETETITLVDAAKKGYTFDAWYNGETKVTEIPTGSVGAIAFEAKFTLDTYNITYDLDGGTNAKSNPANYTVKSDKITLAEATRGGYNFAGWVDKANKAVTEIKAGSTGNIELTATWTKKTALSKVKATNETISGKKDGTITNVNIEMEYRKYGVSTWTKVTGTTVKKLAPGTYYVRYTGDTDYVKLTIKAGPVLVTKVTLNATNKTMYIGATTTLKATVSPTNATNTAVTWKSSNSAIATVSSTGKLTAMKVGTTTITVTTKDGSKKATCKVTVKARREILTATKASSTSVKLTWLKISEADGYEIYGDICGASSGYITKVTGANTLTKTISKINKKALKSTYYKFYVKAYTMINGKKVYLTTSNTTHIMLQTSKKYANATGVKVSKSSVSLPKGKTTTITASAITPSKTVQKSGHGKLISYYTSNASVATVSTSGKITAKAAGTCTIYVVAVNGKYKKVSVTVK